jgi:PKD repeat protein
MKNGLSFFYIDLNLVCFIFSGDNMRTSRRLTAILLLLISGTLLTHADVGCIFTNLDENPDAVGRYEMARMEAENGIIHTVWSAKAGDGTPEKIIYRRSTDGGNTFESQIDVMVPGGELESINHGYLKMKVDGNNVYIASLCGTSNEGNWSNGLFFCKSNDGGQTFSAPALLTETKNYYKMPVIDMQIDNGNIYILSEEVFNPDTYGTVSIFKSSDQGSSFEQIKIEEAESIHGEQLIVDNGNIHVLLYKSYYYYGFNWGILKMATSTDGGDVFTIADISEPVEEDDRHRALIELDYCTENRLIAKENGKIYVAYHNAPSTSDRVFVLATSQDNGTTFSNKNIAGAGVDDITRLNSFFNINVSNSNVNILQRRGDTGSFSHWLLHSGDGGNTFDAMKQIDVGYSYNNTGYGGYHSAFADIQTENPEGLIGIGLAPGRFRLSSDGGENFDTGYMLIQDYYALMNLNTSKFIYTDDAVYMLGYDNGNPYSEGITKSIRFAKIKIKDVAENPEENRSLVIKNSTPLRAATIPDSPGLLDNNAASFTISFWHKLECDEGEENKTKEIFKKFTEYDPAIRIKMYDRKINAAVNTDKGFYETGYSGAVQPGKWQHYTLTYDAERGDPNLKLYLDGVPVVEGFTTGEITDAPGVYLFGVNSYNTTDIYYFDDFSIWDRALTPDDVKSLALNGKDGIDNTGLLYFTDFNGSMYDSERDIAGFALKGEFSEDIPNPPTVDFDAVLKGYDLYCINKTKAAETSNWNFGDGKTSDLANPNHTYSKPGEYNVSLATSNETTVFSAYKPITLAGIAGIDKKKGTNNGNITIRLFGGGLGANDDFNLRQNGVDIEPISYTNPEPGIIEAVFDLTAEVPGMCDVVATVSGNEQVLENAFEIIQADPDFEHDLWVELHGRGAALFNMWQTYTIVFGNNSDVDAYAVPLGLAMSEYNDLEVEFMDFEIETPERAGYDFPSEIADQPLYGVVDELNGEQFSARVYPLVIPAIPAKSSISIRIRVKAPEDLKLRAWLLKPIVGPEDPDGGIIKGQNELMLSKAKIDLAACMIKVVGTGVIDVGTAAIPGVGCAWAVGKNLYGNYQTPPSSEKFNIWSFAYDWGVTVVDCGVNLSGVGAFVKGTAVFFANMYGYARSYNECIKQGVKSGAIKNVDMLASFDPNEIAGPSGYGDSGYIKPQENFPYTIYFENKSEATAPAHIVSVIDTLNEMYSRDDFRFGTFGFGDNIYTPSTENPYSFAMDINLEEGLIVRVSGDFDTETGIISWLFQSLDPETMDIHEDPMVGFLPPNVTSPEGEGFVTFTTAPADYPLDGEVYSTRASIVFDANEPILTNMWINTIDAVRPGSSVNNLESIVDPTFTVSWGGDDAGSGINYYDIYVRKDGEEYHPWLLQTRDQEAEFYGEKTSEYEFYAISTDFAGNIEETPTSPDASTTVTGIHDDISQSVSLYPVPADDEITLELGKLISGTAKIEIFNTKAGTVYEENVTVAGTNQVLNIDTSLLNSGVYFVKISTNGTTVYKNLVISHGCR